MNWWGIDENWWALLFEMLGLATLGFLFYIYQKKKILRSFEQDIDFVTEEITLQINECLKESQEPALKLLETRMNTLKKDRVSFLSEEELNSFINNDKLNEELRGRLKEYQNTLLNRFEKK